MAISVRLLEVVRAGRPARDLVAELRAEVARELGETLADLSGEHATARAIELAEAIVTARADSEPTGTRKRVAR